MICKEYQYCSISFTFNLQINKHKKSKDSVYTEWFKLIVGYLKGGKYIKNRRQSVILIWLKNAPYRI